MLIIAETKADTLYFSEMTIEKAKEPKELFLIDDATHTGLYDKKEYVDPAVQKLNSFVINICSRRKSSNRMRS